MKPVEHVAELLLLLVGEGLEQPFHLPGLRVRDSEDVAEEELRVDQPRPGEQMNEAATDFEGVNSWLEKLSNEIRALVA